MIYINKKTFQITSSPFAIGDFVKIKNYGYTYCWYTNAFKYFWNGNEKTSIPPKVINRLWRIEKIAFHESSNNVLLAYVKDRENNKAVVSFGGLEMFIPFHKDTNQAIRLDSIPSSY